MPHAGVGLRHVTSQGQHQRYRVFGGGDGVACRGVDYGNPSVGGGFQVYVVHANAGTANDLKFGAGIYDVLRDLGLASHDETVVFRQDTLQLLFVQAGANVDLSLTGKEFYAFPGYGVGDNDP